MLSVTALQAIWALGQMPAQALQYANLIGTDPVLPSSFAIGTAAQSSVMAAALAACELGHTRGQARQQVTVDMSHAAAECTGWFSIDGRVPDPWEKFSGLYPCADGWVRIHANFVHHRDGALQLLGLSADTAEKDDVRAALRHWRAQDFEQAAAERGLVVSALRSFAQWDAHLQGMAIAAQPLMQFERMGDAPTIALPPILDSDRPLKGLRVLDLTRIIAGPVGGRTLAAYGADVMLVNAPHLPNIESIMDTSRGKLSAQVDLRQADDRIAMDALVKGSHVLVQGYRPGGLAQMGYGPAQLASKRSGIVVISLSAHSAVGPWAQRRGFDSLVQTATGFNDAEAAVVGSDTPKAMPVQILDFATGFLIAYAASAALLRQQREGGSWHVQLSLAQTGHWLRGLGRVDGGFAAPMPEIDHFVEPSPSGYGELMAVRHSAQLSRTPAGWVRPSMPPGSHAPAWPVPGSGRPSR